MRQSPLHAMLGISIVFPKATNYSPAEQHISRIPRNTELKMRLPKEIPRPDLIGTDEWKATAFAELLRVLERLSRSQTSAHEEVFLAHRNRGRSARRTQSLRSTLRNRLVRRSVRALTNQPLYHRRASMRPHKMRRSYGADSDSWIEASGDRSLDAEKSSSTTSTLWHARRSSLRGTPEFQPGAAQNS